MSSTVSVEGCGSKKMRRGVQSVKVGDAVDASVPQPPDVPAASRR